MWHENRVSGRRGLKEQEWTAEGNEGKKENITHFLSGEKSIINYT